MPGREYPVHPLVGVGGFIHDEGGKVLMIKRKFEPNKGRWSLPGGLVEVGETLEEAARREVREEVGIDVTLEGVLQVVDEVITDENDRVKYHFILIDYLMSPLSTAITLNDESEEFAWFEPEQVDGLDVTKNTRLIFRKFAEMRRKR